MKRKRKILCKHNNLLIKKTQYCRQTLKGILQKNKNVAILLGNGFNRIFYNSTSISWADLVLKLWNESHPDHIISNVEISSYKLSMTETAEMSEKPFEDIRTMIAENFRISSASNRDAQKFLTYLVENKIPIITTNYDNNISRELGLSKYYTSYDDGEIIDPRFQWGRYYAKQKLPTDSILNEFAVWPAHGTIDAPKSICFTLTDYLECAKHAYVFLDNVHSPFHIPPIDRDLRYKETWINLVLNKHLCIVGLSLDENEIFLRLLLMLRFKFMKYYLGDSWRYKGWYLYTKDREMPMSKKFFLESVNVKPIKCKHYNDIYKSF